MIIEKSDLLIGILVVFVILALIYRFWDVFCKKYGKSDGVVYYKWTLGLLGVLHVIIGLTSIVELVLAGRKYNLLVAFAGLVLFVVGQILRNWAIVALGEFHSPHIELKPNHVLIQSAPYNLTRHPYYWGTILEVSSIPLILNAYFAFILALMTYLPSVLIRLFLEERIMRKHFQSDYERYKKSTGIVFHNSKG